MVGLPNIEALNLKQLQELQGLVSVRMDAIQQEAEQEFIADMQKLANDRGLDYNLLIKSMKKVKRKVAVVAPKYKDPDTDKTWSGRGRKPLWVVEALEAGKSLDDFAI